MATGLHYACVGTGKLVIHLILMIYCVFYCSSDAESMEDNTSLEVLNAAKEALLQGLSEENQGLQYVPTISHLLLLISSFLKLCRKVWSDWKKIVYSVFRLYVRNFWSQEKRLPAATLERMLTVLRSLYSCQIEKCFLSLATNLLLEMTSQSPDFKRNIFEYPLSECTFQVSCTSLWVH